MALIFLGTFIVVTVSSFNKSILSWLHR